MTTRQAYERSGHSDKIQDYQPSHDAAWIVPIFWNIKSISGGAGEVIKPGDLRDYCECQGVLLTRQERGIIYAMDAEFRAALAMQRADNDKYMASNNK
jgi:hypothetical protein